MRTQGRPRCDARVNEILAIPPALPQPVPRPEDFAGRIAFLAAATETACDARKRLVALYGDAPAETAAAIVALGGDGCMLETQHKLLGLNLPIYRIFIFFLAALLTAGAVAFVGGVSFIGLIAPHLARMLVGRARFAGILTSMLLGGTILIGADLLIRVAFAPLEVPAGTVTALIGAPYFVYLLMRKDQTNG